ncbi:hypothetical protein GIB67_020794 [Kingdonia uniflora]|uniref:RING-type E3 ubiquitin transferase n=1 Tax=Kingdonia uniflora TaxID=39325 RepID=A0A7J7M744_9MAGN|nr:hypothetical protein GIB67_020794 [Kingdonia uniflora]
MSSLLYFCHQCEHSLAIIPSPHTDLQCPNCHGEFLEELENPNPNPFFSSFSAGLSGSPAMFTSSTSIDPQGPTDVSSDINAFSPYTFLQNYLQGSRFGNANVQFVIENHNPIDVGDGGGFRLGGNLGDYFVGSGGLEQLIQQLAENDPNRYGTPPASKSAVEALVNMKANEELLASDEAQCAVCMDAFEAGMDVKQMPCKHIYHDHCILPWLEMHNSCPVCRFELPTDDLDYERQIRGTPIPANAAGSGIEGGARESSQTPRTVERRFRISLPWSTRPAAGSHTETSDGSAAGNSNSGGWGWGFEFGPDNNSLDDLD